MKRLGVLFTVGVFLFTAAVTPLSAQESKPTGVSTTYDTSTLDSSGLLSGTERFKWQRPDRIMGLLAIRQGEKVADIGAGLGYFSDNLSQIVGESGKVYAVETNPEMVEFLKMRNARHTYDNTVVVQGSETDPGLPGGSLDLVLTVNTWHKLSDRGPLRDAVQNALKPGGRFVVVDWHLGEIPIAPPVERRLAPAELIDEMVADGWTVTTHSRMLKYQYMLIFTPPAR